MTIKDWQEKIYLWSVSKGFWNDVTRISEKIALMHSELSEALEEIRKSEITPLDVYYNLDDPNKPLGFGIELADCVIRIMDTCEKFGIDLESMIEIKMKYNEARPYKHGKKF